MSNFKPYLITNDIPDFENLDYPRYLKSIKRDGIRGETNTEDNIIYGRSLKPIPNKQIQELGIGLTKLSILHKTYFDFEIYSHSCTFQELFHFVMSEDLDDPKTHKKIENKIKEGKFKKPFEFYTKLPEDLKFFIFDMHDIENPKLSFEERYSVLSSYDFPLFNSELIIQTECQNFNDVDSCYQDTLDDGYEGLVLKDKYAVYKFGRSTLKQGDAFKMKPFEDQDGVVIDVTERMENTGESEINELGYSFKHKYKDNQKGIGLAATLVIRNEQGQECGVTLSANQIKEDNPGASKEWISKAFQNLLKDIWENKDKYIGRWITYSSMTVGVKDAPRIPKFKRFRDNKE